MRSKKKSVRGLVLVERKEGGVGVRERKKKRKKEKREKKRPSHGREKREGREKIDKFL